MKGSRTKAAAEASAPVPLRRAKQKSSQSQFIGVAHDGNRDKWRARVFHAGRQIWLGRFNSEHEAAQVRLRALLSNIPAGRAGEGGWEAPLRGRTTREPLGRGPGRRPLLQHCLPAISPATSCRSAPLLLPSLLKAYDVAAFVLAGATGPRNFGVDRARSELPRYSKLVSRLPARSGSGGGSGGGGGGGSGGGGRGGSGSSAAGGPSDSGTTVAGGGGGGGGDELSAHAVSATSAQSLCAAPGLAPVGPRAAAVPPQRAPDAAPPVPWPVATPSSTCVPVASHDALTSLHPSMGAAPPLATFSEGLLAAMGGAPAGAPACLTSVALGRTYTAAAPQAWLHPSHSAPPPMQQWRGAAAPAGHAPQCPAGGTPASFSCAALEELLGPDIIAAAAAAATAAAGVAPAEPAPTHALGGGGAPTAAAAAGQDRAWQQLGAVAGPAAAAAGLEPACAPLRCGPHPALSATLRVHGRGPAAPACSLVGVGRSQFVPPAAQPGAAALPQARRHSEIMREIDHLVDELWQVPSGPQGAPACDPAMI
jgi:hypothetical protein